MEERGIDRHPSGNPNPKPQTINPEPKLHTPKPAEGEPRERLLVFIDADAVVSNFANLFDWETLRCVRSFSRFRVSGFGFRVSGLGFRV